MTDTVTATPFSERIVHSVAGPCRLYVLPTSIEHVVSLQGSIRTTPDFSGSDPVIQDLMVELLDKGTRKRDRFALADLTENRGAQIRFRSGKNRVFFSGRVLREDLDQLLGLIAEMLREPLFDAEEFRKAKTLITSGLQRSMESSSLQAGSALSRRLFPRRHPNHQYHPERELEVLQALDVSDVQAFHMNHVGARELTLVAAGDLAGYDVEARIDEAFGGWNRPGASGGFDRAGLREEPKRISIPIADKQNVDVRLGHALGIRRNDADYLALYLGTFILGGNFSSRLMTVVRDRLGLTYGISAGLAGISTEFDGYFRTAVTLSPDKLEDGIRATLAEIDRIVDAGVTEEEVSDARSTVSGSYKVSLATTDSLAGKIHSYVILGLGAEYLDLYPTLVDQTRREDVDDALRRHLVPEAMQMVLAGAL